MTASCLVSCLAMVLPRHWRLLAAAAWLALAGPAAAWSNHTLGTQVALQALPGLADAPPVVVEPLEDFIRAEASALEALLAAEERWAREQLGASYPPRPEALAFRVEGSGDGVGDGAGDAAALRSRFVAALRINPESRLALYLQRLPGQDDGAHAPLNWSRVTTLRAAGTQIAARYVALQPGDRVAPLDVVASGADEPDYGLDLGLYEDNGTAHGRLYGMGRQPVGNSAYEYGSQAPLHLGYYHEAAIVYRAAPFLGRMLAEYRAHLWRSLALHALRSGHGYWGWRFAGWALHHAQDLTQPYHARVLPGVSTPRMLLVNVADIVGWHGPKNDAVTLVSNRHTAVENYQYFAMHTALERGDAAHPLLAALRDGTQDPPPPWTDGTLREQVSREAHAAADALDAVLEDALPARYVSDPGYQTGVSEPALDLQAVVRSGPAAARARLDQVVGERLRRFGGWTRMFVRDLLQRAARQP